MNQSKKEFQNANLKILFCSISCRAIFFYSYYNGSGNPNQKRNEEISLFGRIFHIVNSYDSMVGGYNYTAGLLPIEAFHIMLENKYMRYDPFILQVLIHRTRYFKLDEAITLPNAIKAKIVG
jgi:HD-GYP domain-containing protein (c-di-GMP phosphodiesterase class II)